jgi:hypothetical protein
LVSGPDGCGKSELLRTALLSLALSHRRSQVQVMGIDLGGREMVVLEALPHALTDVGTERDFSIELLAWLADEVERRFASGIQYPHVFLLIDDLAALFGRPDSELLDNLLFLIENGRSAGLHLILACDEDFAASLQADCLANGTVEARGLADEGRETPVGLFEFRISGRTKRAHIGWMSARDLDTAINLAQAGWRVGLGQTPEELER